MAKLTSPTGLIDTEDYDLVVTGGTVLTEHGADPADVAVRDGRIAAILPPNRATNAREFVSATGKYVLPGLIDSHVHFRTPGLTHKEDWVHGSRAAAAGGITTVLDMPNTDPALFTPADAHYKHGMVTSKSLVDFRFHAGVDPKDVRKVADFSPREATSVKAFLTSHHTASQVLQDPSSLEELFRIGAERDLRLLFHAEHDAVFSMLDRRNGQPRDYRDYEKHRPRSGAIVAVARLIELVRQHGTSAHIVHVSSREEVDMLVAAAAEGLPITFEVTAHHLSFTAADTERCGARIRLSPAIRDQEDQDRLWSAVINGEAMTLGSDHAPHPASAKVLDPTDAPPGLPGTQELFPALFKGLQRHLPDQDTGKLLQTASRLLSHGPARKFGLLGRKGKIAAGYDADLVVFDPNNRWMLDEKSIQSLCKWSAYQGWTFTGSVERTVRRGETIFERNSDGEMFFGKPGGVWLEPGRQEDAQPVRDPVETEVDADLEIEVEYSESDPGALRINAPENPVIGEPHGHEVNGKTPAGGAR